MNKLCKVSIALAILLGSAGCAVQNEKLKVVMIVKSTTSQFFKSVQSGASAASKEYNIDLTFMGPENEEDYQDQILMIDKAIENKADAIVLSSIDYNNMVEPVERAADAKIPVIIIDSDVNSDKVVARITTNNASAGKMAGNAVDKFTEKDIVVGIVNFDANTANGQEREQGFRDALKTNSHIRDIYTINVQSNIESATYGTKELLRQHPEINMLATFNEWTTLGVGYAIKDEHLMDETFVVGFDNNPISVEMLETGEIDTLIVQNPFAMGYLGVEKAQNIVNKKEKGEAITYTTTVSINKNNMFNADIQKIVFPFN